MMTNFRFLLLTLFIAPFLISCSSDSTAQINTEFEPEGDPPFSGTIFIDPNIVTEDDPTTFESLTYAGQESRRMFDRREGDWITVDAYLFDAAYDDGLTIEIQVNPEFDSMESAEVEAERYAPIIGQLTTNMRRDVETVWIHKGTEPFGGGNNNLLIHTGQSDLYIADGILEETLIHEAAHTSLDSYHADSQGWRAAQEADNHFISTYARDNPDREDVAESYLPYLAIRYFADRIPEDLKSTIEETIPNRIAYFDEQEFDLHPMVVE